MKTLFGNRRELIAAKGSTELTEAVALAIGAEDAPVRSKTLVGHVPGASIRRGSVVKGRIPHRIGVLRP
jgi:hypothetical protein